MAKLHVRILHDNLTHAHYPVLVSHYRHDVIVAAEKYLDDQLDGRLSELLRMELYAGPINTGVVVLNEPPPGDLSIHPGAIVAGLGRVGELTPGSLTSTLAHALTVYGAECAGRERRRLQRTGGADQRTAIAAPVTAILVGSGEGGLTLADSVRALLRAVLQANHRLGGGPQDEAADARETPKLIAQIDRLDIIELYEDRAIEAVYALRKITQAPEFSSYEVEPLLASGKGGLRRARFEQGGGWWQRIRITSDPNGELKFEAITQTARAPAHLQPTQRDLVDGFVRQAIETTGADAKLGHTLFELLVPNDFKAYAPDRQKLALMLNAQAAEVPWELMHDGIDRVAEPVSVSGGMIRQLLDAEGRQQVLRAPGNTALVVGNPLVSDERFPPLGGAAREATAVAGLLGDAGYQVQLLLEDLATPTAVLTALHAQPWRILHLAAHGVFEFSPGDGKPAVSGLVLNDGMFFTAAEADQLRYVPEVVFINCCHLGQTRGDAAPKVAFHRLAANLATQFIRMGARAVVAAGWAVDDAAAKTFASTFYRGILEGELFGDAVLQARKDTFDRHGHTNTWGAYQCYGDVSFSLRAAGRKVSSDAFVSPAELCVWLDGIVRGRAQGDAARALLADLVARTSALPDDWRASAELSARTAAAFAELGEYKQAIEHYDRVLTAEEACAPVKALEQLANYRVRWAQELVDAGDPDQAMEQLALAEVLMTNLLNIGETSERWSLLAGVMKRRALFSSDATARRDALREMSSAYANAFAVSKRYGPGDTYPLANHIAAEVVLSWQDSDVARSREGIDGLLNTLHEIEGVERARGGAHTDTFNLVSRAERSLLEALVARQLDDETTGKICEEFGRALSRGATPRERDSIGRQLDFFRKLMATEFPDQGRTDMIARLGTVEERVLRA